MPQQPPPIEDAQEIWDVVQPLGITDTIALLLVVDWIVEAHPPPDSHEYPYEQHPVPSVAAHLYRLVPVQLRGQHAAVTLALPLTVVVDLH
jgi:hypothetical protein